MKKYCLMGAILFCFVVSGQKSDQWTFATKISLSNPQMVTPSKHIANNLIKENNGDKKLDLPMLPYYVFFDWGTFPSGKVKTICARNTLRVISPEKEVCLWFGRGYNTLNAWKYDINLSGKGAFKVYVMPFDSQGTLLAHGKLEFSGVNVDGENIVVSQVIPNYPVEQFRLGIKIKGDITINEIKVFTNNKNQDDRTLVDGEIIEITDAPSPQGANYPDCFYTAKFSIHNILRGESCPQTISLLIPAFNNFKKSIYNGNVKKGTLLKAYIKSFDKLSDEAKRTQQADDLQLFDLQQFVLCDAAKIRSYKSDVNVIPFSETNSDYVSIFNSRINGPISPMAIAAQKKAIADDLKTMTEQLNWLENNKDKINSDFSKQWKCERDKDLEKRNRIPFVPSFDLVWRYIVSPRGKGSFWAAYNRDDKLITGNAYRGDVIQAIVNLKEALEANGIQLIVIPEPNANDIALRIMNPDFKNIPDYQTTLVCKQLLEAGIEAIYVADKLIENYDRAEFMYCYPGDPHPGDTAQEIFAESVVERLKRYNLPSEMNEEDFYITVGKTCKENYCYPANCDIGAHHPGEIIQCRHIKLKNGNWNSKDSNILFVSNSYGGFPGGGGFCGWLAAKALLKTTNASIHANGDSSVNISSFIFSQRADLLKNKKVVIIATGQQYFAREWNDIRMCDNLFSKTAGKTCITSLKINLTSNDSNDAIGEPKTNNFKNYKQFSAASNCEMLFLHKGNNFFELKIPDNVNKNQEVICVIQAVPSPGTDCKVSINEQGFVSVYNHVYSPPYIWKYVIEKISPRDNVIKINIQADKENSWLSIKGIFLYQ